MEGLIAIAIQFTIEVVGSAFVSAPIGFNTKRPTQRESETLLRSLLFVTAGGMIGWMSAYFLPFSLLPYSWLKLLNIAVAPLAAGTIAWAIAKYRARENLFIEPGVHFRNAFWFTLAFALVRIAYLARYGT